MVWALIQNNVVVNTITADQAFINSMNWSQYQFVKNVTSMSPQPCLNWTYDGTTFSPPVIVVPPVITPVPLISIGTVASGAPGSNPIITNTGTDAANVLNFVIPQGAQGTQGLVGTAGTNGTQGIQGIQGITGAAGLGTVTPSVPLRSLNSAFQPSATKACLVTYSVSISCSMSLTSGQEGRVDLMSDASATPSTIRSSISNSNSGTLTIGLALTQKNTLILTYLVPAGHFVKLVTSNVVGTPTFAIVSQCEEILG